MDALTARQAVIACALGFLFLLRTTEGQSTKNHKCYVCAWTVTGGQYECQDKFYDSNVQGWLMDNCLACYKSKIIVDGVQTSVVRECVQYSEIPGCRIETDKDKNTRVEACHCSSDKCNAARRATATSLAAIVGLAVSMATHLRHRSA